MALAPAAQLDEGGGHLDVACVRRADDLHDLDGGMPEQERLDLGGGDVLAADLEHVLQPADEGDAAVLVDAAEVARVVPAVLVDHGRGQLRLVVVADEARDGPRTSSSPTAPVGDVRAGLAVHDA